jgi:hypothetical protein
MKMKLRASFARSDMSGNKKLLTRINEARIIRISLLHFLEIKPMMLRRRNQTATRRATSFGGSRRLWLGSPSGLTACPNTPSQLHRQLVGAEPNNCLNSEKQRFFDISGMQ